MTIIPGRTRWNITIVDTDSSREMHLRSKSDLAGAAACAKLADDLQKLVTKDAICVFSGSLPDSCALDDLIRPIRTCHNAGAKIVLDSSGPVLKKIVDTGLVWLIKPNVLELSELIEEHIDNNDSKIARAARELLEKTEVVLISRGSSGAMVVTRQATFKGTCNKHKKVLSTVGCGDYLLAGFLNGIYKGSQLDQALKLAIKTATAKAWGWSECHEWQQIKQDVEVEVRKIR
jgi:fructose-1-phosphate kinase PfkB-like protein